MKYEMNGKLGKINVNYYTGNVIQVHYKLRGFSTCRFSGIELVDFRNAHRLTTPRVVSP